MAKLRVLLVDDHALVRRGFRRLLEDDAEIEVVGEAADGQQAEELAASLQPDVIVLDYALPGQNGALTARRILAARPDAKILILSMHSEPSYVARSREAGASGYLLKNALDLELVQAVKQPCVPYNPLGCRSAQSPMLPQFRITAADRQSAGASNRRRLQ